MDIHYSNSGGVGPQGPPGGIGNTGAQGVQGLQGTSSTAGKYGGFQYLGRQAVTNTTLEHLMPWDTVDFSNGVTISNTSRINFTTAGLYNIQWSGQFQNANSNVKDISVWLKVNGVNVPGSTGFSSIPMSHASIPGHSIVGWNYFLQLTAGQYIELAWSTESTDVSLESYAVATGPTRPATAALIFTAQQVA